MARPPIAALIIFDGWGLRAARGGLTRSRWRKTPTMDRLYRPRRIRSRRLGRVGRAAARHHGQLRGRAFDDRRGPRDLSGRDAHHQGDREERFFTESPRSSMRFATPPAIRCIYGACLSDGSVHSHIDHLMALLRFSRENGAGEIVVHCGPRWTRQAAALGASFHRSG